jgi:cytochrome P450
MAFKPERYFGVNGYEPERDPSFTFGYGRRVCPGRILADSFVFLTIAQTLSTFRLSKAVENGKEVDPLVQFLPGVISHPAPFKITITPRSPDHEALIRSVEKLHPWQESDSKFLNSVKN